VKEPRNTTPGYIAQALISGIYRPKLPDKSQLEMTISIRETFFHYRSFNNELIKVGSVKLKNLK